MIYCTDVFGLSAAAVSVVMLIARLYDAVNNPFLGSMIDKTKSKMGRYRPWILIGGIGLAISTCLLFWAHPDWPAGAKNFYVGAMYILVATFATIFYMGLYGSEWLYIRRSDGACPRFQLPGSAE